MPTVEPPTPREDCYHCGTSCTGEIRALRSVRHAWCGSEECRVAIDSPRSYEVTRPEKRLQRLLSEMEADFAAAVAEADGLRIETARLRMLLVEALPHVSRTISDYETNGDDRADDRALMAKIAAAVTGGAS